MEQSIKQLILAHSTELFGQEIDASIIQFQKTRKDVEGDLTLVIFPFVKMLKCSPLEAGAKIGQFIVDHISSMVKFEVVSGFLNLTISTSYWLDQLNEINKEDTFGYVAENSKPTVMVEYSSPNTNKPLHLGHLRNNFLGYSVAELLKAFGHKVVKTQVINDRGIHICKSMLAWEKFSPLNEKGERETPENTGLKGDKLVGKYYVEFDKHFNAEAKQIIESWDTGNFENFQAETIEEYKRLTSAKDGKDEKAVKGLDDKIKDLAKNQTSLLREAKEMLVKWEAKDPQTYLLWTTMNNWVYKGFDVTYKSMGVDFDQLYYESETYLLGKDIVLEGLQKGVFFKKEDGSVWIDLTADGLDEKLVLRSDGTAVYMTQDIGTAIQRVKDHPDVGGMVYTVGNEQDYHFKVLFLILQKLGFDWASSLFHLSYGMVDLPSGKMKSREGTVVDADDLMQEMTSTAQNISEELGKLEGYSEEEKTKLYNTIGLGALKYYILKVDPKKRILFNPEESVDFAGNTGPFIQYTYARIQSIIRKATFDFSATAKTNDLHEKEKELLKQIELYPEVIQNAAQNHSPALIANYTYELVREYNSFYQAVPILGEENQEKKIFRVQLSKKVADTIASSFSLLGINVPERM